MVRPALGRSLSFPNRPSAPDGRRNSRWPLPPLVGVALPDLCTSKSAGAAIAAVDLSQGGVLPCWKTSISYTLATAVDGGRWPAFSSVSSSKATDTPRGGTISAGQGVPDALIADKEQAAPDRFEPSVPLPAVSDPSLRSLAKPGSRRGGIAGQMCIRFLPLTSALTGRPASPNMTKRHHPFFFFFFLLVGRHLRIGSDPLQSWPLRSQYPMSEPV